MRTWTTVPSAGMAGAEAPALKARQFDIDTAGWLGGVWSLARPYWVAGENAPARRMLATLLAVKCGTIYLCVRQNHWFADFYAALQSRDPKAFLTQIGIFAAIAAGTVVSLVYGHWLAESIKLHWRNWLVRHTTDAWLADQAYYRLQLENKAAADPDQRIVEDLGLFAGQSLNLTVGFLDVSASLTAFTGILWTLSGTLTVAGVSIAGYMAIAAFVYAVLASWLTHRIGHPLAALHSASQGFEADFRYGLVRLRENAETVAFYAGEDQEAALLAERWAKVRSTVGSILRQERTLGWFTHAHGQFSIVLPFLLAMPRYFDGQITFAQVMQVTAAFGTVQACLSFFISSYGQIAQWRATTERLMAFRRDLDGARQAQAAPAIRLDRTAEELVVRQLHLALPDGRAIVEGLDLSVERGQALLVTGPSGTGKSTLLRAFAGLWPHGNGQVCLPGDTLFVPQRPYLPLGSLRQATFYPAAPEARSDEIKRVLEAVALPHLIPQLDRVEQWSQRLSGGEQQRIAFARVFLTKPRMVFLDEATSALDEATEGRLYRMLREADWKPTIVSVGHRSTLAAYHDRMLQLDPSNPANIG